MNASNCTQMDDADAALIIQLLQEDTEKAVSDATGKGKQPEGAETDAQIAFNLFLEELQRAEIFAADRRMARSMQQAVQADGDALVQSQDEERVAQDDHNLSIVLSTGESGSVAPQPSLGVEDEDFIEKLSCIYITGIDDVESDGDVHGDDETVASDQPEGSAWAAFRRSRTRPRRPCDACGDRKHFAKLARAPCQHEYFRQCLTHLFQDAMVDESLFPPRCCKQPIPLDKNRLFLSGDAAQQFCKKALEFSTPRRTYCHSRNCASFIPPTNYVDDIATCDECSCQTCITCKSASHGGDCPNDEQLQHVIQLAREQGWQRCQNCWGMVELNTGCNHMTCRCGFQFCYVCGARWKTCQCEHWEERRLYERAAEIDARDQVIEEVDATPVDVPEEPEVASLPVLNPDDGPHADNPGYNEGEAVEEAVQHEEGRQLEQQRLQEGYRQQRLQEIMQNLRRNHECDHERWFGRRGPRQCEECHDVMPIFIYECR